MPAKLIIVLEKNLQSGRFRAALWADVPVGRQAFYAVAGATSAWSGATAAEHAAIAAGQVAELVIDLPVSDGATATQLRAELILRQATYQAEVTTRNPWIRYGTFFDGAAWTVGGAT